MNAFGFRVRASFSLPPTWVFFVGEREAVGLDTSAGAAREVVTVPPDTPSRWAAFARWLASPDPHAGSAARQRLESAGARLDVTPAQRREYARLVVEEAREAAAEVMVARVPRFSNCAFVQHDPPGGEA